MPNPVPPERSPWYTPAQAATYLQCSARSIYRLAEEGILPTHRLSSRITRFHRDDLDQALGRVPA